MGEDFVESIFSIVLHVFPLAVFRLFYTRFMHQNCSTSRSMMLATVKKTFEHEFDVSASPLSSTCIDYSNERACSKIDFVARTPVAVVHLLHGKKTMLPRENFLR